LFVSSGFLGCSALSRGRCRCFVHDIFRGCVLHVADVAGTCGDGDAKGCDGSR
jgi:hypothetical protein